MLPLMESRPDCDHNPAFSPAATVDLPTPRPRRYEWFKSVADMAIALALFMLTLPIMLAAALLVKLTSRGPVIYTQARLGRHGWPFYIYKLRTMYDNCEALSGPRWCTKGDPRVTPVGRILRRTHIDELPQLLNVLRGDMSLVGPRPERPEIVMSLESAIPGYRGRLAVRPGVTGLAQIQLPADTNLESVSKKLVLDLVYVRQHGPSLDVRIAVGTAFYLVGASYATVRRLMALPAGDPTPLDAPEVALDPS